jgi:hypothetical protein
VRHRPALLVQDALPVDHVLLVEVTAFLQLLPGLGRNSRFEEVPHFMTKRYFFLAVAEIHLVLLPE